MLRVTMPVADKTICLACPVCHATEIEVLGISKRAGNPPVYGCTACRNVWVQAQPITDFNGLLQREWPLRRS